MLAKGEERCEYGDNLEEFRSGWCLGFTTNLIPAAAEEADNGEDNVWTAFKQYLPP